MTGDSKAVRLRSALLDRLHVHQRERMLHTSARFLYYELVQAGIVAKPKPLGASGRRSDQDMIDALTQLREKGLVPWDWIEDETRTLDEWQTAPTVAEYVTGAVAYATIDRWNGQPAPLILCESRSLTGVLRGLAALYACPLASTNGQTRGFLVSKVAPTLESTFGSAGRTRSRTARARSPHQKELCSTRRRAAGGSARAADTSHDVVDDDVADIAVDGMAGEATAAKEAVESAFDWPVGVLLAAISRVQELPHERMNVGVGHR